MINGRSMGISVGLAAAVLATGVVWKMWSRSTPASETSLRHGDAGFMPVPEVQFAEHKEEGAVRTVERPSEQRTR